MDLLLWKQTSSDQLLNMCTCKYKITNEPTGMHNKQTN